MSNGTEGRVYGGDPNLIHVKDGTRAKMGADIATLIEHAMRSAAFDNGSRTFQEATKQSLCPGCYMVVIFNAAAMLAQRNGQSATELGRSLAQAFQSLEEGFLTTEEITVILDPPDSCETAEVCAP